jgi:NAD(P)-dependent dehydrogenase (short-subunit alcohol dehydrogenase family)
MTKTHGLVEGKVALVTGAASGIGLATARLFAREGAAAVVLADLDAAAGESAAESIRESGGHAEFVRADCTSEPEVDALVSRCVERHGRLDCAHNNAGITGAGGPLHTIDLAGFEQTLRVNLFSVFLCMKAEIRVMLEAGRGSIVNTSSGAGLIATPNLSPYCASKHAILGITKTAAVENARTGVRINSVCPGTIDTPMLKAAMASPEIAKMIMSAQPSGRLGEPSEIAEAVVWLCSDRASYVTGESMIVDGGAVAR